MIKKYIKEYWYILVIIVTIILIILGVIITTPKPQIPHEYKIQIDSLTKTNNELIKHQNEIDSLIGVYEYKINEVDYKIDNIKEKTTIIKEYYHEQISSINSYQPNQVDSFFKNRYNY